LNSMLMEFHQMTKMDKEKQPVSLKTLHQWIDNQLSIIRHQKGDSLEFRNLKALMEYVESPNSIDDSERTEMEMFVLSTFLYVVCTIIQHHIGSNSLRNFFLAEYHQKPFGRNWRDYIKDHVIIPNAVNEGTNFVKEINPTYFVLHFDDFYRSFCYAYLRMVDMHDDFDAVLSAVRLYVPSSSAIGFSKEMKDYLHSVIYQKTAQYDRDKLSVIKESYFAMTSLQTVIRNHVIRNW